MSLPPPDHLPDKTILSSKCTTFDNLQYKRRKGTPTWTRISTDTVEPDQGPVKAWILYLVRFNQYPEEPLHWALVFSSGEGASVPSKTESVQDLTTHILEVRGEPEEMFLVDRQVSQPLSLLEDMHSTFALGDLNSDKVGRAINFAKGVKPPRAKNRANVQENCQGWCFRAVEELVERKVLHEQEGESKLQMMKVMMEKVVVF